MILSIISIILLLIVMILAGRLYVLKRELRNIKTGLIDTRNEDNNQQISVTLVDQDLVDMSVELNHNLDYQKQLKLEAEQAKQQMKQSISDIAHDLRTPITVVKGNLQMLANDPTLSAQSKEYLTISLNKTETLKGMVDEFFDLAVLESDTAPMELDKVDLTRVLVEFMVENEAVIREKELMPELRLPEKSVYAMANEQLLMRMLSNLLNNVVKYARDSFVVSLEEKTVEKIKENAKENDSGKEDFENVIITISNRVDPTKPFDVERLFDRTYRGEKARTGQGAGLGLYIVKLLAQKQNVKVEANITDGWLNIQMIFAGVNKL